MGPASRCTFGYGYGDGRIILELPVASGVSAWGILRPQSGRRGTTERGRDTGHSSIGKRVEKIASGLTGSDMQTGALDVHKPAPCSSMDRRVRARRDTMRNTEARLCGTDEKQSGSILRPSRRHPSGTGVIVPALVARWAFSIRSAAACGR